jgi:hypothetical protein
MRSFVILLTIGLFLAAAMAATCRLGACPLCSEDCSCTSKTSPAGAKACRLDCLLSPSGRAERRKAFEKTLRPRIQQVRELADGYALGFESDDSIIMDLAAWIRDERKCCRFLDYCIRVDRNSNRVWFEATGDAQGKERVAEMMRECGVTGKH